MDHGSFDDINLPNLTVTEVNPGLQAAVDGWPDEVALNRILAGLCAKLGLDVDQMPEGLRRRATATHRFLFNYNGIPVEWDGVTIAPAGVSWRPL